MFDNPSLVTRVAIGKSIGLVFGLIGFFLMPYIWPEGDMLLRLGVLFWYVTVGAFIGVFGVMDWHPILRIPLPWWIRASWIGGWMNFVLTLFAYDTFEKMMIYVLGPDFPFLSPFWFVLEGVIVGLIIGYFATKFGGEGKATVLKRPL